MALERDILVDIHTHHPRPEVLSPRMAGIHPWDATEEFELPDFASCDIIGETGLDFVYQVDKGIQERLFRAHLEAAKRLHKPVVLHVVKAFEPTIKILEEYHLKGVVFHGFVGSEQQATEALRRGYYLSFGERSLRSQKTQSAIALTPIERLFAETDDNPELDIATIIDAIAELKHLAAEELKKELEKNYKRLIIER
ncbi:MAG: TatD family hydrolase [Alistipes sp.]|nr:TatD family hydrolase [Alistipes sp.]